jgi:hypothetical protein
MQQQASQAFDQVKKGGSESQAELNLKNARQKLTVAK